MTREFTTATASEAERDSAVMKVDRRGSTSRNGSVSSSASSEWGPTGPASHTNTGEGTMMSIRMKIVNHYRDLIADQLCHLDY